MASDSNRDNSSSSPSSSAGSNPENPFIKFRQFADAQISSILQGIIGLPSAFSKNASGNARWAEFDEDLRRRDELRARQKQMKDSEPQWSNEHTSHKFVQELHRASHQVSEPSRLRWDQGTLREEADIPARKWSWGKSDRGPNEMDEQMAKDIPLYSPIHKTLFSHLDQRGDDSPDWSHANFINSIGKGGLVKALWPEMLRQEQQSPDVMKTIQYIIYNSENCSAQPSSKYSLVPYLLFSPYSPLKLLANRPALNQTGDETDHDGFPYCEAFQDLISTMHNVPNMSNMKAARRYEDSPPASKALFGNLWIRDLCSRSLLEEKQSKSITQIVEWPGPHSSPNIVVISPNIYDVFGADTEQDMYDAFASEPAGMLDRMTTTLDAAMEYLEKDLKRRLETPEGKRAMRAMLDSKLAKDIFEMMKETENVTKTPQSISKSENNPNGMFPSKPSSDGSRVIQTSTISERNENESGSVETKVTVWKLFADGRESTTTTTHSEDATGWKEYEENERESNAEEMKPKEKKTGWFWN